MNIFYSDLSPTMAKDLSNDVSKSINIRAVKNALLALITTRKGSRPFYPDFGCNLSSELFENISPLVENTIQNSVIDAIRNFEPRIAKLGVTVVASPDDNSVLVKIVFSIITDPDAVEELRLSLSE